MVTFATASAAASPVAIGVAARTSRCQIAHGLGTGRLSLRFDPACSGLTRGGPPAPKATRGKTGEIRGVVTGPGHTPIAGICVLTDDSDSVVTGADGSYLITRLTPGRYHVGFVAGCGNAGSYAPQVYPGTADLLGGLRVLVRAGQVRRGVDAVMRPGGTIAGTLTDGAGQPLGDICVAPAELGGPYVVTMLLERMLFAFDSESGISESAGRYRIANVWPGRYDVEFFSCGKGNYAPRWFRTRAGAPVSVWVGAGAVTSGVSAVMRPGGTIGGTVTQDGSNQDKNACVLADPVGGSPAFRGLGTTEVFPSKGSYSITGLAAGRYAVETFPCDSGKFGNQWYPDATGPATAAEVSVVTGKTTKDISVAVTKGGSISGRVTSAITGRALRRVCVQVLDFDAESPMNLNFVNEACTNRAGRYRVGGLGGKGSYALVFGGSLMTAALLRTGVNVHAPAGTTGVNAAIADPGSMSGTVISDPGSKPAGGTCVTAFPVTGHGIIGVAQTSPSGRYELTDLTPGTYKVLFAACTPGPVPGAPGQAPQWYPARDQRRNAALVRIRAGRRTTGIGARLAADGRLSGTVTTASRRPLDGICVTAVPASPGPAVPGFGAAVAVTSRVGKYTIGDLAPGRYKAEFSSGCGSTGYVTQWWRDADSPLKATEIAVRPGSVTTGIDAALIR